MNIGVSLSFGFVWGAAAIIPREQLLRDGTQKYFPPWLLYGFVLVMFVNAIWHLRGGAQASASCTELLDAVSSLRLLPPPDRLTQQQHHHPQPQPQPQQPSSAAAVGGDGGSGSGSSRVRCGAQQATPDNLIRIDGVCRYAEELNQSQVRTVTELLYQVLLLYVE